MKQAQLYLDRHFAVGETDDRLFGSFIEHLGRAVYGGIYQPGSPLSDERGFRRDVLALVRELNVPLVRYPGGNFVSGFCWEDSVGPAAERRAKPEAAWGVIESNQFGLNEFSTWAKAAGTSTMMAVNLATRGTLEAKNLLEYCNLPGGTYYSDLRCSHGFAAPHDIKLWCLGNEMDGPWQIGHKTAYEYGRLANETGRLMKMLCPEIELVACGSSSLDMPTFGAWESTVLDECYDTVDYLSMHQYYANHEKDTAEFLAASQGMDRFISQVVSLCDAAAARRHTTRKINLSFDEWNVWYHSAEADKKLERWCQAPHQLEDVYNFEDALLVGSMLITLLRHADRVKIACLAQLVNVIAPIMTSDTGAWRQTIFWPYYYASRYGRGRVMNTLVESPSYESKKYGDAAYLDAVFVENDADTLTLFAVNKDMDDDMTLCCDLRQYAGFRVAEHIVLTHDDRYAVNTEAAPDTVCPVNGGVSELKDGRLTARLGRHSWNMLRLVRAKAE
ncbi:MAG: alpha-N-arabinofuranosidase [Faecalibacterium sp.]|jgi:alpha-N-arabinofuranosidase|nr:alpha-N-arabinofuranosidase [Faecalibacterium sp.]